MIIEYFTGLNPIYQALIGTLFTWFMTAAGAGMWSGNGQWEMGYHHMTGGGMGMVMIIFWVVLIGALVLLISGAVSGMRTSLKDDGRMQTPLEMLKKRYARGDIDRAEYEDKRRELNP